MWILTTKVRKKTCDNWKDNALLLVCYHVRMKKIVHHLPYLLIFGAFLGVFFWFLNDGLLGHDYYYYFPKLLDGKWHFLRQGLAPFYYSPHFCGGFPEYANPQAVYYSLAQMLVIAGTDLWHAVQLTMLVSMLWGYVGWYLFGKDLIGLKTAWAHLLALIVSAHGFHFMHMVPGHVPFHSMPLIGWMLWLLLDRHKGPVRHLMTKGALFALTTAYILYSGGYMVFVMLLFALIALVPFDLLLVRPVTDRLITLLRNGVACAIGAIAISLSKLVATFSLLQHFPRELPFERLYDDTHMFVYMFRALFALPQRNSLFTEFGMPATGAIHEYSLLVSPVVLFGLACGAFLLRKKRSSVIGTPVRSSMIAAVILMELFFFAQLARGHGFLVTPLETLPIFSGLHVNMRYLYAFSFLPIAVSVWCMARVFSANSMAVGMSAITVAAFVFGYAGILQTDSLPRIMDYDATTTALDAFPNHMRDSVETLMTMGDIIPATFLPFVQKTNIIDCMEPMLLGSSSLPDSLHVGDITKQTDGAFNMYNPACMIYPDVNNCAPGDRIASEQDMRLFTSGEKTSWKQSPMQTAGNRVSLLSLCICMGILLLRIRNG